MKQTLRPTSIQKLLDRLSLTKICSHVPGMPDDQIMPNFFSAAPCQFPSTSVEGLRGKIICCKTLENWYKKTFSGL